MHHTSRNNHWHCLGLMCVKGHIYKDNNPSMLSGEHLSFISRSIFGPFSYFSIFLSLSLSLSLSLFVIFTLPLTIRKLNPNWSHYLLIRKLVCYSHFGIAAEVCKNRHWNFFMNEIPSMWSQLKFCIIYDVKWHTRTYYKVYFKNVLQEYKQLNDAINMN